MIYKGYLHGLLLVQVIFLFACSGPAEPKRPTIEELETELFDNEMIFTEEGKSKALDLVTLYMSYAEKNPDDTMSAGYLFKAADITMNLGDPGKAIGIYNKIIYTYPGYQKVPECMFLVAYIYENYLQNYGKAKDLYEEFIRKYPDNAFADDAKMSIKNMGKTPEELIREFEQQNAETEM